MITRFAPSPTGRLHLGHAYAALVAHDLARRSGGTFLLRFEDIDHTRVRPEYYTAIEEDLAWLGLTWDGPALRQNTPEATARYAGGLDRLIARDVAYPCFCTRKAIEAEIAAAVSAPHGPEGPLYPGTCRGLSAAERGSRISAGESHGWRLDSQLAEKQCGPLMIDELRQGRIKVDAGLLGDVILARKDIGTSYHLAVVLDDAVQGITLVTRGEDLLAATHVHRMLQRLLDLPEPEYFHHPLICDASGRRLAKRHDALSLASMRAAGAAPGTVREQLPPVPRIAGQMQNASKNLPQCTKAEETGGDLPY